MRIVTSGPLRALTGDAVVAFGLFGAFWGAWGASIPRIQRQAGLDDGQFGLALLFIGAAALPAMIVVGHAIDRVGVRVAGLVLPNLCIAGAAMSLTARSLLTLCIGLGVVGAASGASDVAINALAGQAEVHGARAVITRSHGTFSTLVVLVGVGTGICTAASLRVWVPFAAIAVVSVAAGARLVHRSPPGPSAGRTVAMARPGRPLPGNDWRGTVPLVAVGVLGALAFASENAHQSWSAIFARDVLHAPPGVAAGAPALFAAVVAVTRFGIVRVPFRRATVVIVAGSSAAMLGAVLLAVASDLTVAALGLAVAAAGTGVLFPTLMRIVSRSVDTQGRGRATSVVTSVSYLGFLLGPVYVGAWADATGLRAAMLAVAALAAALAVSARALLRRVGMDARTVTAHRDRAELSRALRKPR
jgi:MFS family permease